MERTQVTAVGLAAPAGHYSHGIVAAANRWLFVAGQVPLDEKGGLVGGDDAEAQADQALLNLQRIVEGAGGDLAGVVKTTVYLVDLADRQAVARSRQRIFPDPPPANTLLIVAGLADPRFRVEIEAIVALP